MKLALEFHATESHANPRVKLLELPPTSSEAGAKVPGGASDNSIKSHDSLRLEVIMAHGQRPNLVFEFLQGFWSHPLAIFQY